jgi:hypothetical protein
MRISTNSPRKEPFASDSTTAFDYIPLYIRLSIFDGEDYAAIYSAPVAAVGLTLREDVVLAADDVVLRVDVTALVVVAALLVDLTVDDGRGASVFVFLMLRYVLVGVSGTAVVGSLPTVISASPLPCWPSIPMTM